MTTIYNYDPQTSEYLHESVAALDPLEGQPLIPAFATTKMPPAVRQNEVAVFDGVLWKIVPDYRGLTYWLGDKSEHSIDQLGMTPPEDALDAPPLPTLDELKQAAAESIISFASDARATLTGHADLYKVAGWNDKSQRARRVVADTACDADLAVLQAEADRRGKGETLEQLAHKQLEKAQALAMAVSVIDGLEIAGLKTIDSIQSAEALDETLNTLKAAATAELNNLLQPKGGH